MAKLLKLKPAKIRALRQAKGLSWRALGEMAKIHQYHLAKMERSVVETTTERKIRALARALDTHMDMISEHAELSDIERWANYHNLSPDYAKHLAREGRIEGARKDDKGHWRMDPEAEKLAPTEVSRKEWKRRYRNYGADYQRRRRAALREAAG
jgi:transcriptional regulator with XRE-family HTH domain